jgi:hypothetical protein
MDLDFVFRLGLLTPMCYVDRPLVEIDRTENRAIGLTTEFPPNGAVRLEVQQRTTTKWLAATRHSHPHLRRPLLRRLWGAQSVLANHYLLKGDFSAARSILRQSVRSNPKPTILAKFIWSVVSPRSLRWEIIRRHGHLVKLP